MLLFSASGSPSIPTAKDIVLLLIGPGSKTHHPDGGAIAAGPERPEKLDPTLQSNVLS